MRTDFQHFTALWKHLRAIGDGSPVHQALVARYAEPQRAYHTLQHLGECLREFDLAKTKGRMSNADAVEMALWMHDAVYNPKANDNEERSAVLAHELLNASSVDATFISEVERLILATKTHLSQATDDSGWMVDIDLAILGQPPARFREYEDQIWQEYSWVPRSIYKQKRAEVLECFLNRDRLFVTEYFHDRYEAPARENLAHITATLRHDSL